MRQVEINMVNAIKAGKPRGDGNTAFDGRTVTLHGHPILCIAAMRGLR